MMTGMPRALVLLLLGGLGLAAALHSARLTAAPAQPSTDRSSWRWYKGNTHAHTLESDGDSTPDEVTRWYKEHGYQFLVLSDHNVLTPTADLAREHGEPERFLLVPGEEVTDAFEKKPLHINGLNVTGLVEPRRGASVLDTLQRNTDAIRAARGVPHVNHPNFGWAIAPDDLQRLERYRLLEIFNGHPLVNNFGGGDRPGMEAVWDRLLTAGRRVYGIAVDDAHYFKRPWDPRAPKPGQGWVVVHAPRLEAGAVLASLENGDFYASTGIEFDDYTAGRAAIAVRIRPLGDTRYTSRLIGAGGRVLAAVDGPAARFDLTGRSGYARLVVDDSNGARAWGQPVFLEE